MYVPNKSIQIFRQGPQHARIQPHSKRSQKCEHFGLKLTECVLQNKLNILNHPKVRQTCETDQWRSNCNHEWRRYYIEEIYRKRMNRQLYNQKDLDKYMKYKTNLKHSTFLGES